MARFKQETIGTIRLAYHPDEQETATLIGGACERSVLLIGESWGLRPPADCRIYVMTSWSGFVFRSAPWAWRLMLGLTVPLWGSRIRRTWPLSAAWTQRYGQRVAIGIKPPRLLQKNELSIGVRMFEEEKDPRRNVEQVTCHELVHACSAHLRLPMWLNEGLAAVTAERFAGKPTIRQETLDHVRDTTPKEAPPSYRELARMELASVVYHGSRGYWLARYLEETHPGFLREQLAQPGVAARIETEMISALGMEPERFWQEIDDVMVHHFRGER